MNQALERKNDRILGPGYLENLESLPTVELRARRSECHDLGEELSYTRRLLQGKVDILNHELERRSSGGEPQIVDLIKKLPAILADSAQTASPRLLNIELPAGAGNQRREVERLASGLADAEKLSLDELSEIIDRLVEVERTASQDRKRVQEIADALNQELVRRYREGTADPAGALHS